MVVMEKRPPMEFVLVHWLVQLSAPLLVTMLTIHLVMPFRNRSRGLNLRPVNRIKHVVDFQGATALGVAQDVNLISTTDTPVITDTEGCETGSKVNAVYLRVEVVNTGVAGVLANAYLMVFKSPGASVALSNPNVVGADKDKRFVIHQEMVMLQMVDNSNPRTLFNGVIVIPRGYRRNGPSDLLIARVFSPGVELNICMQCHYKEFR